MADDGVWCFRNRRCQDRSSCTKACPRGQGMQVRKKNSRQRLFQTCETLSSSGSAVNAYGRLKTQYLCWPTATSECRQSRSRYRYERLVPGGLRRLKTEPVSAGCNLQL